MRRYLLGFVVLLLAFASVYANNGTANSKKKGPPWQETVASLEYHHLTSGFDAVVLVPTEPGMYRVNAYASNEGNSPDEVIGKWNGEFVLLWTDDNNHPVQDSTPMGPNFIDAKQGGWGTATVYSTANRPIRVRVEGTTAPVYSLYITVERL
jgi:hypothetical protein